MVSGWREGFPWLGMFFLTFTGFFILGPIQTCEICCVRERVCTRKIVTQHPFKKKKTHAVVAIQSKDVYAEEHKKK